MTAESFSLQDATGWTSLPYHMRFAVATGNTVQVQYLQCMCYCLLLTQDNQVHDTLELTPLAIVRNIHYGSITDLSWSVIA